MHIDDGHFEAPEFDPRNIDPARLHGYRYDDLNRSCSFLNGDFLHLDRDGVFGDPLHAVDTIAKRQEYITILDAGCGTGYQLYDLVEASTRMFCIDARRILADGVSDYDFSDMCDSWRVRKAFVSGMLNYHVGDLNTMELPENAYDLAYSYEVLVHNQEPNRIVSNLWRALRPGGMAYFNAEANQAADVDKALRVIRAAGGVVVSGECTPPALTRLLAEKGYFPMPRRMAYRVTRPA